ncbi:MAG: hypothetical protein JWM21_1114 [Acidobacteria bacterium]|nr:hypothetical protein [Acidobacteriota bacterium]
MSQLRKGQQGRGPCPRFDSGSVQVWKRYRLEVAGLTFDMNIGLLERGQRPPS